MPGQASQARVIVMRYEPPEYDPINDYTAPLPEYSIERVEEDFSGFFAVAVYEDDFLHEFHVEYAKFEAFNDNFANEVIKAVKEARSLDALLHVVSMYWPAVTIETTWSEEGLRYTIRADYHFP